jgi:hypothetical protein
VVADALAFVQTSDNLRELGRRSHPSSGAGSVRDSQRASRRP